MVAAGDAVVRYVDGVSFETFEANDEKREAVERSFSSSARRRRRRKSFGTSRPTRWPEVVAELKPWLDAGD